MSFPVAAGLLLDLISHGLLKFVGIQVDGLMIDQRVVIGYELARSGSNIIDPGLGVDLFWKLLVGFGNFPLDAAPGILVLAGNQGG